MIAHLRPAVVMLVLFTALTGLGYPLLITGIAHVAAPYRAGGSLIVADGKTIGSELIGQPFTADKYFHPRPSATSAPDPKDDSKTVDAPYNAANSSGSNLGPTSQKLIDRIKTDVAALRAETGALSVPADAVTTSGSGLDPEISPAFAKLQATRIAKARKLPEDTVRGLISEQTQLPVIGLVGEPRLNVLSLNLALDRLPSNLALDGLPAR